MARWVLSHGVVISKVALTETFAFASKRLLFPRHAADQEGFSFIRARCVAQVGPCRSSRTSVSLPRPQNGAILQDYGAPDVVSNRCTESTMSLVWRFIGYGHYS